MGKIGGDYSECGARGACAGGAAARFLCASGARRQRAGPSSSVGGKPMLDVSEREEREPMECDGEIARESVRAHSSRPATHRRLERCSPLQCMLCVVCPSTSTCEAASGSHTLVTRMAPFFGKSCAMFYRARARAVKLRKQTEQT